MAPLKRRYNLGVITSRETFMSEGEDRRSGRERRQNERRVRERRVVDDVQILGTGSDKRRGDRRKGEQRKGERRKGERRARGREESGTGLGPGGSLMPGTTGMLLVPVSSSTRAQLEAKAAEQGIPVEQVASRALRFAVEAWQKQDQSKSNGNANGKPHATESES
jgi:hypothetical protein